MNQATEQDFDALFADIPEIVSAQPQLHWFGLIGRRGSRSVSNSRSADLSGVLLVGTDESIPPATTKDLTPMVIGKTLADELGLKIGDIAEVISQRPNGKHAQPVRHRFQLTATTYTGRFDQDIDR